MKSKARLDDAQATTPAAVSKPCSFCFGEPEATIQNLARKQEPDGAPSFRKDPVELFSPFNASDNRDIVASGFDEEEVVQQYACTLMNIGGKLLQRGNCSDAMKMFQETVQMMILAEDGKRSTGKAFVPTPTQTSQSTMQGSPSMTAPAAKLKRMEDFLQRMRLDPAIKCLPADYVGPDVALGGASRHHQQKLPHMHRCSEPCCGRHDEMDCQHDQHHHHHEDYHDKHRKVSAGTNCYSTSASRGPASSPLKKEQHETHGGECTCEHSAASTCCSAEDNNDESRHHHQAKNTRRTVVLDEHDCTECRVLRGISGLFHSSSKLCGATYNLDSPRDMPPLVFSDPFFVDLTWNKDQPKKSSIKLRIRADQCAEGTLFNMGVIHYAWGSVDSAVRFFELSMSLAPPLAHQGCIPLNPVILACLNNLGQINTLRGRLQDAKGLVSDALTRGSAWLAQFYLQTRADRRHDPRYQYHQQQQPSEMKKAKEKGLTRFVAGTLMNMGEIHFSVCDYDGAITSCKDALKLLHPDVHPMDAAALHFNMALIYRHQSKPQEAIEKYSEFLLTAKNLIPDDHPQVAIVMHDIGLLNRERGRLHHDAIRPLLTALAIRKKRFGRQHHLIADTMHLIGRILHEREDLEDALFLYRKALTMQQKVAAQKHDLNLEVSRIRIDIGRILHTLDRHEESLSVYEEVLDATRKVFGNKHAYVAKLLNVIGNLQLELDRVEAAMRSFAEALRIQEKNEMIPMETHVVKNRLYRVRIVMHKHAGSA